MTAFGPQLIGQTEKTLNALLRRVLADSALTEPEWVTLRVASQNDDRVELADLVAGRTHFDDAPELVASLTRRGLVADDGLTPAGRQVVTDHLARIAALTAPLWADLAADDVAATERVLNAVVERARDVLAA